MRSTTGRAVVNSLASVGVKTNPTIYAHASAKGAYDSQNVYYVSSNNTENNHAENTSQYDHGF